MRCISGLVFRRNEWMRRCVILVRNPSSRCRLQFRFLECLHLLRVHCLVLLVKRLRKQLVLLL